MSNQIQATRKIIHIDMDAFFASVEQRDNPELRGKAIAVGGGGRRGVTTTASYEARKYGVGSAMPGYKVRELCPHIIFVPPRFDAYKAVSIQIREIFARYTDLIEPLSFDEAFLDVTENKINEPIATELAMRIKNEIKEETQLTCSAGVSYCKFIAKIASDLNKPDGITVIKPSQAIVFLEQLEVKKFFGVGKVTARKMESMGIHTGADLKKYSKLELAQHFGKSGRFFYDIVRGIDNRPVESEKVRKSLGIEQTLNADIEEQHEIIEVLDRIIDKFYARLTKADNFGRTITLKLKDKDFKTLSRSKSEESYIVDKEKIREISYQLLEQATGHFDAIRLMGLTASKLQSEEEEDGQISLF